MIDKGRGRFFWAPAYVGVTRSRQATGEDLLILVMGFASKDPRRSREDDFADAVIGVICDIEMTVGSYGNSTGVLELRLRNGSIFEAGLSCAGDGGDIALWINFADIVSVVACDIDVAFGINDDISRDIELCLFAGTVFVALFAGACDGGDIALWVNFADAVVVCVGYV